MGNATKMTLEYFSKRVAEIHSRAGDWEATHSRQDSLVEEMVNGMAEGLYTVDELKEFAKMLLELRNYTRWYA